MNRETHSYSEVLHSLKRALKREIVPAFRGIAVEWKKETIFSQDMILLFFYIDGPISEDLRDLCGTIGAEVISDFCEGGIQENIIRHDAPSPLPEHTFWVYKRKE